MKTAVAKVYKTWTNQSFLIVIFIVFFSNFGYAQSDYFIELEANKSIKSKNEKYIFTLNPNFRMMLNNDHWKRFGVNVMLKRNYLNWSGFVGLSNFYVFDDSIPNFFEIRPYLGLTLQNKIIEHLDFKQSLRYEIRNMIYQNSDFNVIQNRIRLNLAVFYTLENKQKTDKYWQFRTEAEFYMIKQKEFQERFVDSREFTFKFVRGFGKDREFGISYRFEKFNKNFDTEDKTGSTLGLEYNF